MTSSPPKSLIPFCTGQTVCEVYYVEGRRVERLVKITGHDDDTCWTADGGVYLRETGAALNGGIGYRAIHTNGYGQ